MAGEVFDQGYYLQNMDVYSSMKFKVKSSLKIIAEYLMNTFKGGEGIKLCCSELHNSKYFVEIQTTLKEISYILLWFEWEMFLSKAHWNTWSRPVVLFKKILEQLGSGFLLEEMNQWGMGLNVL